MVASSWEESDKEFVEAFSNKSALIQLCESGCRRRRMLCWGLGVDLVLTAFLVTVRSDALMGFVVFVFLSAALMVQDQQVKFLKAFIQTGDSE